MIFLRPFLSNEKKKPSKILEPLKKIQILEYCKTIELHLPKSKSVG